MASAERSRIDPYGFERPDDFDYDVYQDFLSEYLKVLAKRKRRWLKLRPQKIKRSSRVKRYIRKGIPDEHRKHVWLNVSGAQKLMNENPTLYWKLLDGNKDEQAIEVIKIDIPRTFPENIYFQNPSDGYLVSLYNVLVAFVAHRPEVGYCQGLNYIAGLLLLVVKDEEAAFWLLNTLIEKILPDYYSSGMNGLRVDTEVLAELIRLRNPVLHEHLKGLGLTWPLLCTKWFICLFVDVLPIETVLRIWDCLLYEGNKVILRVGISLMLFSAEKLLRCSELGEALNCIHDVNRSERTVKCHQFMQNIFKVPGKLTLKEIDQLRQKYSTNSQVP